MNIKYSADDKERVVSLFHKGTSVLQLSSGTGIPRSTIYRWIKESETKSVTDGKKEYSLLQFRRLEQRIGKLERMLDVLQKVNCKPTDPLSVKLQEMDELYGQYSIHTLCDALCVDRSTFYNHILRSKKTNTWFAQRREIFRERIQQIYDESNQIFGPKKIRAVLQDEGYTVSAKFVGNLMKDMGLISIRQDAKDYYDKEQRKYRNYVNRQFNPTRPNEIWVGDITLYSFHNKNFYICAILDLFSRRIVSYKIGITNSTNLTKSTFKLAYESRCRGEPLIFHSDRGCNFRSKTFCDYLRKLNVVQSFSRVHMPYDNSVMESFFSNLKREELYRTKYRSEREFRTAVDQYIQFYNERRPHHHNAYKTPAKRELEYIQKHKTCRT